MPGGYEFVELHNTSASVILDLAGVKFTQGIDFAFPPGTVLHPDGYLLVIGTTNIPAFRAHHGLDTSVAIVAAFSGSLNNGGEALVLRTAAGGTDIVAFTYRDGRGWPVVADGAGHSLIFSDAALGAQGAGTGEYGGNWRASRYLRGSPGRADSIPAPTVRLNEIAAHTDFETELDSNDWIELFNPTDADITLNGGWYLSDDAGNLKKWLIPGASVVPAHGWLSFDEQTGFHNPTNIGFGLSKDGEQVFLSYLPGTAEDRVVDAVTFKAQENDWSLGRHPDGAASWYQLTPRTRDAANAAPPGRVEISEVLFHPPDLDGTNDNTLDEFIEIHNATSEPVALWNTNRTWRLDGGVGFSFPTNLTLAADEYLLVVNFDPATNAAQLAAFRALYGLGESPVRILGPYSGKLANDSDRVAIEKPLALVAPGDYSWVVVDEVVYADQFPWPCGNDGSGNSLQRFSGNGSGSNPANWTSQGPGAGRVRVDQPAGLPAITQQPRARIVATNGSASFSVSICGAPPLTYQWLFNAGPLPGRTDATLLVANARLEDAGGYSVVVGTTSGSVTSDVAQLSVQLPPLVLEQPDPVTVIRDQTATFEVTGSGTPPLSYQWQRDGVNLPGANSSVLVLTNVQAHQAGSYSAVVFNGAGAALSSNALLTVLIPATITNQPVTQTVTNGINLTLSVGAYGSGALQYQWSKNGVDLPGATSPSLVLTNVQVRDAGTYRVLIRDVIGSASSQPAVLTVLERAVILVQPVSQTVVRGGTVILGVMADGTKPMGFRWRRSGSTVTMETNSSGISFLVQTNVTAGATYTVIVTNVVNRSGLVSANAVVTVLADSDGDGLPDAWEAAYNLNTNSVADAAVDSDGDTLSNRDEYTAGTDPRDETSFLKIEDIAISAEAGGAARLSFMAVSNRTYTLQWRAAPGVGDWSTVGEVMAATNNRMIEMLHPIGAGQPRRFYQLVTPRVR